MLISSIRSTKLCPDETVIYIAVSPKEFKLYAYQEQTFPGQSSVTKILCHEHVSALQKASWRLWAPS
jgi:hypothetical protein